MSEEGPGGWLLLGIQRDDAAPLLDAAAPLLDDAARDGRPRIRWYASTDAAVVLGRGQRHADPPPGYGVLQRPSGGGAVLMDDELLSADIALPADHPWLADPDLGAVFLPIGEAWAAALTELGVADLAVHRGPVTATRLGPVEQRPLAEVCYASLGRGEVTAGRRKLVGLSQRRRRHGALIQCGIHRTWAPDPLIEALGVGASAEAIRAAAVGLDQLLPSPVSDATLVRTVQRHLTAPTG